MSGHLMSGFRPKSSDNDPAMRAKKIDGIEPCRQRYKTFYGCNYVAIGVTQSKSKRNMPLVA
jgi:hypothetical protein